MILNTTILENAFDKINAELFNNELTKDFLFKVGNAKTSGGYVKYRLIDGKKVIYCLTISKHYCVKESDFYAILIHEMIHVEFFQKNIIDNSTHGYMFCDRVDQINEISNYDVQKKYISQKTLDNVFKRDIAKVHTEKKKEYNVFVRKDLGICVFTNNSSIDILKLYGDTVLKGNYKLGKYYGTMPHMRNMRASTIMKGKYYSMKESYVKKIYDNTVF